MQSSYQNKIDGFFCAEGIDGLSEFGANLHSSLEVVLLLKGETKVWVDNKNASTAREGDAIVIFPNKQYRYETVKKEEYVIITADVKKIGELLYVVSSFSPAETVIKGAARDKELREIAKNIIKTYNHDNGTYRDTVLKGYVMAFLGRILSMTELKKNEIEQTDTLNEIISYCNLHFREKLSLESLETALHMSKYYISHVINEQMGEGFNDYVNSIRINEASRLLADTDKAVKEISEEVGFGTVRTFDRAFKKQKGETAKEYRERNREKVKKD